MRLSRSDVQAAFREGAPAVRAAVRETVFQPTHAGPRAGDIVIYQGDLARGTCVVSVFRHASTLTFHTYGAAVCEANEYAKRNHVDAWCTRDSETFEVVANHR